MLRLKRCMRLAVYFVFLCLMFEVCISSSLGEDKFRITLVNPPSAYWNDMVHVQGTGATPKAVVVAYVGRRVNETYIVSNATGPWTVGGSSNVTVGSTVADELGTWNLSFRTPLVLPRHYNLYAFDNSSLSSDAVDFEVVMNITILPHIERWNDTIIPIPVDFTLMIFAAVTPSSGPPGTLVMMHVPSASGDEIVVYFDDSIVARFTGLTGDQNIVFAVPNVSAGSHTVRAIAPEGRWESTATFQVTMSLFSLPTVPLLLLGLCALALLSLLVFFLLFASFLRRRKLRLSARSAV